MAVIVIAHPFGLQLEAVGNRNENDDFAFIGLKVIRTRGGVGGFILCKLGAGLIKAFFGGLELPLEILDFMHVVLITPIKGLKKAIGKASKILG